MLNKLDILLNVVRCSFHPLYLGRTPANVGIAISTVLLFTNVWWQ